MTDAEIIDHFGGPARLAERLGWMESRAIQRIHNWRRRGIPAAVKLRHADIFLRDMPAAIANPQTPNGAGAAHTPTTSTCTPEQENNTSPSQPTERSVA